MEFHGFHAAVVIGTLPIEGADPNLVGKMQVLKCGTCKGKGRIRVRPKAAKKDEAAPRQSKFMRHMNMYGGNRRVSMTTLMRKIP